jgi:hypothetical protein
MDKYLEELKSIESSSLRLPNIYFSNKNNIAVICKDSVVANNILAIAEAIADGNKQYTIDTIINDVAYYPLNNIITYIGSRANTIIDNRLYNHNLRDNTYDVLIKLSEGDIWAINRLQYEIFAV